MSKKQMVEIIQNHNHDQAMVAKLLEWDLISDTSALKASMQVGTDMFIELQRELARIESEPVIPGLRLTPSESAKYGAV